MQPTSTLLDAFSQLEDPRGMRHPFSGIVVLMLLGMLARILEMESDLKSQRGEEQSVEKASLIAA